jgi:hypothetical protein
MVARSLNFRRPGKHLFQTFSCSSFALLVQRFVFVFQICRGGSLGRCVHSEGLFTATSSTVRILKLQFTPICHLEPFESIEPHGDDKKSSHGKTVRSMASPPLYFSSDQSPEPSFDFRLTPGRMVSEKRDKSSIRTRRIYLIASVHRIRECPLQSPKWFLPHVTLKWSRPCRSQSRFGTNNGWSAVLLISERSKGAYLVDTSRIAVE